MATIDIVFNDKTYSIEESAFEAAAAALRTHFLSAMSGSGASINLGCTTYNIDSTKLSAATTNFVTHLGKISGSGSKVTVGGVEYSFAPSKVQDAIADLEVVLGDLQSGDGDSSKTVILPETMLEFTAIETGGYQWQSMDATTYADILALGEGDTVKIEWDGVEYTCTGVDYVYDGFSSILFGNLNLGGLGDDTGEPFILGINPTYGVVNFNTFDQSPSHTVAIYKVSGGNEGDGELVKGEAILEEKLYKFGRGEGGIYMALSGLGNSLENFELIVGDSYCVVLNGNEYTCVAKDFSGMPLIGNLSLAGMGDDTGEPFFAAVEPDGTSIFATFETGSNTTEETTWHTIAIYKVSGGNGGSAQGEVILAEQTVDDFFLYIADRNIHLCITSPVISLEKGEVYRVIWDGKEYECVCEKHAGTIDDDIGIGNWSLFDQNMTSGVEYPFLIGNKGMVTNESATSHTVAIYKVAGGNGSVEGEVVLAETVLNDFEELTNASDQLCYNTTLNLDLTEGQIYRVVWDGQEYLVDAAADDDGVIFIGNFTILFDYNYTNYNTHAPFLIATNNEGITELLTPEAGSHTIAIYKVDGVVLMPTQVQTSGYNSAYGLYTIDCWTDGKHLTIGNTYRVIWDGVSYDCIAEDASSILDGAVFIGNGSIFGLNGNNEPFVIGWTLDGAMFVNINDTEETNHSFAVYDLSTPSSNLGEEVLAEQTVSVEYYEPEQNYIGYFENPPILVVGETYIVILDGVKYECTALDFSSLMVEGAVGLNFNDGWGIVTYDGQAAIMINDTEPTTHSVAIYKVAGGNGGSSEELVFAEQTVEFEDLFDGLYMNSIAFTPVLGETYRVVWDGQEYVLTAHEEALDGGDISSTHVYLGNITIFTDGDDTGEPFLIMTGNETSVMTYDTASSHTVAVYKVAPPSSDGGSDNSEYEVIMPLNDYNFADDGGMYGVNIDHRLLNLGDTYRVVWDGQEYDVSTSCFEDYIVAGNLSSLELGDDTGEPFIILAHTGEYGTMIYAFDTATSHNVGIYRIGVGTKGEVLLAENTYAFENHNPSLTPFYKVDLDFSLTEGEIYRVVWEEQEYVVFARLFTDGATVVAGNFNLLDDECGDTGEPFIIVPYESTARITTTETANSHYVGIYKNEIV